MPSAVVDQYLDRLDEPKRSTLVRLRRDILAVVPDAEQCLWYAVPGFKVAGKTIAGFAIVGRRNAHPVRLANQDQATITYRPLQQIDRAKDPVTDPGSPKARSDINRLGGNIAGGVAMLEAHSVRHTPNSAARARARSMNAELKSTPAPEMSWSRAHVQSISPDPQARSSTC